MDPQSLFRMISRYRLLQTCLRNVSISPRDLCVLSSIQFSSQTAIINLILQGTKLQRFSSFGEPPTEEIQMPFALIPMNTFSHPAGTQPDFATPNAAAAATQDAAAPNANNGAAEQPVTAENIAGDIAANGRLATAGIFLYC
ncbi:hypothetical protein DdX_17009 [Ditylenchus destructor]|uniref:Uncharacterized protein n=1 Tax=Ditylenchus destructor TaxID=166010 RepID=A0AAD4QTN9_9BILA|nr:hypothetical protein DdX_17009 [Ditylenchus destructor]